ncbi:hypothetical protein COK18_03640 [Bacillus cereus]|nr:hypothetical protein COK18_03640 [Bacillus cereus]
MIKKHYFYDNGCLAPGWIEDEGKTYFMTPDQGADAGWLELGVEKYYFNNEGVMQTGGQQIR